MRDRHDSVNPLDDVPADVLHGLAAQARLLVATHPEWVPSHRQSLASLLGQLRQEGRHAEAQRVAAFDALLAVTR